MKGYGILLVIALSYFALLPPFALFSEVGLTKLQAEIPKMRVKRVRKRLFG